MNVSVIIPTYNRAHLIRGAVLSVASQTEPPSEIIVVDDGSTDNTRAVLEGLRLPNLVYVYQEKSGANAARNAGLYHAQHDWVAFHDSDDFWLPNKLATCRAALDSCAPEDQENIDVIFSAFCLYEPRKRSLKLMPAALNGAASQCVIYKEPLRQTRALVANPISTQTLLVNKKRIVEVGNFDNTLKRFQDWDLAIRLANTSPFLFITCPLCYVAISSDSLTRNFQAGLHARKALMEKHARLYMQYPFQFFRAKLDLLLRTLVYCLVGKLRP